MIEFNFKSQIATTIEQSERLLSLGLKKETADMVHCIKTRNHLGDEIERHSYYSFGTEVDERPLGYANYEHSLAWSLHRLIEMMPTLIGWRDKQYWLDVNNDGVCYSTRMSYALVEFIADNLYDNIIFCIEWLIKEGYFNNEYLV